MDNLIVTTFDPEVAAIFRRLEGDFLLGFQAAIHVVLGMLNPWPVTMTGSIERDSDRAFLYDQDVAFLHAMLVALDNGETRAVRAMITDWISELES